MIAGIDHTHTDIQVKASIATIVTELSVLSPEDSNFLEKVKQSRLNMDFTFSNLNKFESEQEKASETTDQRRATRIQKQNDETRTIYRELESINK